MKKEEWIRRYGKEVYEKHLSERRAWGVANPEKVKTLNAVHNPVNKEAKNAEVNRKGGKYHETVLRYRSSGVPLLKCKIRSLHNSIYRKYKLIIDPLGLTQIHHEY